MGINLSKAAHEPEKPMLGRQVIADMHVGALHQLPGNFRLAKPLETSERRQRISATKSVNLPFGHHDDADDIVSKSTESTDGSPDFEIAADTAVAMAMSRPGTWFHRPSGAPITNKNKATRSHIPCHYDDPLPSADDVDPHIAARRSLKRKSSSLPLKCPPRNRKNRSKSTRLPPDSSQLQHHASSSFTDNEDENDHLQHLYDMRTWDMYLRITEARRKQNLNHAYDKHGHQYSHPTINPPGSNSNMLPPSHIEPPGYGHNPITDDIDPIPLEVGSMSGHVMIFGDLE
ncbi:hypothetical protein ACA910_005835 [Epithemia clementina (nom. ined.)]